MGLLFFFTSVLDLPLAHYFDLMRAYSRLSQVLQSVSRRDPIWQQQLFLANCVQHQLHQWTTAALLNQPVDLRLLAVRPTHILFVDASAIGWGAIYFDLETGAFQQHQERWSLTETFDVHLSAWAEPEAAWRAACRFVRPIGGDRVHIVTDSTTTASMLQWHYSPSYIVNGITRRFTSTFGTHRFTGQHIPGTLHPSDSLSRFLPSFVTSDSLRRVMVEGGIYVGSPLWAAE